METGGPDPDIRPGGSDAPPEDGSDGRAPPAKRRRRDNSRMTVPIRRSDCCSDDEGGGRPEEDGVGQIPGGDLPDETGAGDIRDLLADDAGADGKRGGLWKTLDLYWTDAAERKGAVYLYGLVRAPADEDGGPAKSRRRGREALSLRPLRGDQTPPDPVDRARGRGIHGRPRHEAVRVRRPGRAAGADPLPESEVRRQVPPSGPGGLLGGRRDLREDTGLGGERDGEPSAGQGHHGPGMDQAVLRPAGGGRASHELVQMGVPRGRSRVTRDNPSGVGAPAAAHLDRHPRAQDRAEPPVAQEGDRRRLGDPPRPGDARVRLGRVDEEHVPDHARPPGRLRMSGRRRGPVPRDMDEECRRRFGGIVR
ncbi:hypothetical protein THAOC_06989 [Thalassiosira oceanica]|uniref:Uncharacterized protein n=1 Tax=Thalassiosira oceanica TaxID=159749 RepID=K0SYR6_THAOC|nr:hypothetical protein THAOC_06989 [Thalassiosira oceanica]|eukprot:EJK71553.1 hypothetical protein THAOC_06989 [Thalassiosira oceanica]